MSSPCGAKKGGGNSIQVMYLVTVAVGSDCIAESGPAHALYQELLQVGFLLFQPLEYWDCRCVLPYLVQITPGLIIIS